MSIHPGPENHRNVIHFFKILKDNNFHEELKLPGDFVRKHCEGLSNPILLKLPSKVECKVYWIKRNGDIWLTEGWRRFSYISGLKHEYLLLFKYKGGSSFEVIVCDKSALETDYSNLRCEEVGNEDYMEIVDDCTEHENHVNMIHFFKVLVHDNFEEEMMTPTSFVEKHWNGISNPIHLKLPNDVQFQVYWTKEDEKIWLRKGWKRFAEMCGLKHGYFLFFEYKGGSSFEVAVCDGYKSALEIDYSASRWDEESTPKEVIIGGDDDRDGHARLCKTGRTNTGAASRSRKVVTNSKTVPEKKKPLKDNNQCSKDKAVESANAYKSKLKNPSFVKELSPTYVKNDFLHVPSWFSREYVRGLEGTAVIGVCGDMTTWKAKIGFFNSNGDRAIISGGWKSLCQKYELEADDVCVFERTGVTPLSFKIEIFRARGERQEPSCDRHLQGADQQNHDNPERDGAQHMEERDKGGLGKRKRNEGISRSVPESDVLERADRKSVGKDRANQAMEKAKAFQSNLNSHNPSFIREIKKSYIGRDFLRIPILFSRDHLRGSDEGLAIIRVSGDTIGWPVTWRFENCSDVERAVINGGWKSFSLKYDLKAGDVCVFERTEVMPLYFKVEIFRASREEPSSDHHLQESGSSNMLVNQFMIEIKKSHLRPTIAYIPAKFMKRHAEFLGKEVTLQVEGKMSPWPVKVIPQGCGAFSKGWTAFVKGCKLKVGDVCLFEIIDEENMVFKVSIQHN